MKSLNIYKVVLAIVMVASLFSCKKDPGNYDYKEVAEAMVSNLDQAYTVFPGDSLVIKPEITYANDTQADTSNYNYEWLLIGQKNLNAGKPTVMGTGTTFRGKLPTALGLYSAAFRITDKRSGVWKQYPFNLLISNRVYQGWFVLSETSGQSSRLDMLSFSLADSTYTHLTDVLAEMESPLKLQGKPNFVKFMYPGYFLGVDVDQSAQDRIVVGTAGTAATLGTNTLNYSSVADLDVLMPSGNSLRVPGVTFQYSLIYGAMSTAANNVYYSAQGFSNINFKKINVLQGSSTPFRASGKAALNTTTNDCIVFDEDKSEFLWSYAGAPCVKMADVSLFPNPINKDLLFIRHSSYSGGGYFAILKNKTDDKVFLARFTVSRQIYFSELTGSMMDKADHFEVSDDFGYIFYNVGGKLYEYDFITKTNKEMVDYGNKKISLIKFEPRIFITDPRYQAITKQLIVCSYAEDNLETSGTMELFTVPALNAQIVKRESYTGFGKIASVTYRFR